MSDTASDADSPEDDRGDDTEDGPDISVAHQARFTENGDVTTEGETTATSLGDFGAEVDTRERETRLDRPEASEFGVDDRPEVAREPDGGEQAPLFADVDPGQQTLTGDEATMRFLFADTDSTTDVTEATTGIGDD